MKYFDTLPLVSVTRDGYTSVYRNLLTRVSMIPSILKNPLVYYSYDLQEGDTPEIVAEKYYGSPYRFWIILFANEMLDPQWDWPLNSTQFEKYIIDKYSQLDIDPYTTTKAFRKQITTFNQVSGITNTFVTDITESEYNSMEESTIECGLTEGTVTVTTSKVIVSYYDYEIELNESKRSIKLLNKDYVQQIETEFRDLLSGV